MSAKWRRKRKNTSRFDISDVIGKVKRKSRSGISLVRNPPRERKEYSRRIGRAASERRMKDVEPLVDILEGKTAITVVAELAGFEKEHLRIYVKNQRLTVSARSLDRKFYKSLNLPKRVNPTTMSTTFKNGVLEVNLTKAIEEKTIDKAVD